MAAYDINGQPLAGAYDINGDSLNAVYDINGDPFVFNSPYLTVMTFNVQGWSGINNRTALIEKIFVDNKPDICGMQECSSDGIVIPQFLRKSYNSGNTFAAQQRFFTNIPMSDVTATRFTDVLENRGYMKAYINVNGKRVAVFNTHIEVLGSTQHYTQPAELYAEFAKETYFIALGDFNFEEHSTTGNEWPRMAKPLIDAGYNLCNWTQETGFVDTWFGGTTTGGYDCPCDNIITSANIDVLDIVYDQTKIEAHAGVTIDHIPVIASLKVN